MNEEIIIKIDDNSHYVVKFSNNRVISVTKVERIWGPGRFTSKTASAIIEKAKTEKETRARAAFLAALKPYDACKICLYREEDKCGFKQKPMDGYKVCMRFERLPKDNCSACEGRGWFYGGERGERTEVCDCYDAYMEDS